MKKILVVDDDISILDAIELILIDAGYQVETAGPEHIYEKIIAYRPDVLLLDIRMSGNDGRTICKTVKQNQDTKSIPIVMIAAIPYLEKEAKNCGADDFLTKPFVIDDLLRKIEKYLK